MLMCVCVLRMMVLCSQCVLFMNTKKTTKMSVDFILFNMLGLSIGSGVYHIIFREGGLFVQFKNI